MSLRIVPAALFTCLLVLTSTSCQRDESDVLSWMSSECLECTTLDEKAFCDDGLDNDEDGLTDCEDKDCEGIGCCGAMAPLENLDELCNAGCDNDGDGFTDCGDWSCSKTATVTVCKSAVKTPENTPEACSDGIDNDWNGHFDCADFSCSEAEAVPFCEGNDATCSDGIDNDGNGFIDCKDFSCSKNSKVTVCK